ncbi:hypothetical protein DL95DRAFT_402709 [Leptodontidium sp. 2 PMI_412]|nr:hypothetical protein DL95DRAFT_402709 [Leptodontidium sp. 2 PMI_412]
MIFMSSYCTVLMHAFVLTFSPSLHFTSLHFTSHLSLGAACGQDKAPSPSPAPAPAPAQAKDQRPWQLQQLKSASASGGWLFLVTSLTGLPPSLLISLLPIKSNQLQHTVDPSFTPLSRDSIQSSPVQSSPVQINKLPGHFTGSACHGEEGQERSRQGRTGQGGGDRR